MMNRLNILAPYLALGLFGYLAYSEMDVTTLKMAQAREPREITAKMLRPALLEPRDHSSPADRDPFEVSWSSYQANQDAVPKPAAATPSKTAATAPEAEAPLQAAAPQLPPPLPRALGGVIVSQGLRKAIIDEKLYREGQELPAQRDGRFWTVESIRQDSVTLRFCDLRKTLSLVEGSGDRPRREGGR